MDVLAVDIGTTWTKAAILDESLTILLQSRAQTPAASPDGTIATTEVVTTALATMRAAVAAYRERAATNTVPDESVGAIGVTGMLSHVFLDASGSEVTAAQTWAAPASETARSVIGARCRAEGTSIDRPVSSELLAPRLLDLARADRAASRRLARVVALKDAVVATLVRPTPWTPTAATAPLAASAARSAPVSRAAATTALAASAAASGLSAPTVAVPLGTTDYSVRDYSLIRDRTDQPIPAIVDLLTEAGYAAPPEIVGEARPPHYPAGVLGADAARYLGVAPGISVAIGATDGTAAMYGGGILDPTRIVVVFGTTDVVMRARRAQRGGIDAAHGLSCNAAAIAGWELVGGSTGAAGRLFAWGDALFPATEAEWAAVPPGSEGVRVFPGIAGERAPWNRPGVRGAIVGLTRAHSRDHIARAMREAATYRVRRIIELVAPTATNQPPTAIVAGGGARTAELDALREAILPFPVQWAATSELSLRGAAIFAFTAREPREEERDAVLMRYAGQPVSVIDHPLHLDPYEERYRTWCAMADTHYQGDA